MHDKRLSTTGHKFHSNTDNFSTVSAQLSLLLAKSRSALRRGGKPWCLSSSEKPFPAGGLRSFHLTSMSVWLEVVTPELLEFPVTVNKG